MFANDIGMGRTGIGDNFARSRLLLAKRAGYLPQGATFPGSGDPGAASAAWRSASKNLAVDARAAGFANPLMFLRAGAQAGGKLPTPQKYGAKAYASGAQGGMGALAYANSRLAALRTAAPQMGGGIAEFFTNNAGVENDPAAAWRQVSAMLAQAANQAGYTDPRRFIAAMQPRKASPMTRPLTSMGRGL